MKAQVENIRKEKSGSQNILDGIKRKCIEMEHKLELIREANYLSLKDRDGTISKYF